MARMYRISSVAIVVVCASCGSDSISGLGTAEFDELCGHDGPVRILPLDADPNFSSAQGELVGDRYVFSLRSSVETEKYASTVDVWSVGRCGEDPVLLVDDGDLWISVHPDYDDVVFFCDDSTGWITALDVYGVRPAKQVIETRDCFSRWTDFGVLTILADGQTGPLVLHPWPADPLAEAAEQIVLVDDVKIAAEPQAFPREHEVFGATATEAFAITAADELVVIDLDSHAVTILAEGVREFDHGAVGRWLVWQGVEVTNNQDPKWPQGPTFVLDRESGDITEFAETALAFTVPSTMRLEPLGLLHYRAGYWGDDSADRWIRLPSLDTYAVGGGMQPVQVIDDTRALLNYYYMEPYVVLDVASAEVTTIYDGPSHAVASDDDGLLVLTEDRGELVRVSYSGESRTLARRVNERYLLADDDRVITPFAVNDHDVGQLVIVDPATLDEHRIDDDVHADSSMSLEPDQRIIGYVVVDPDPERSGLWIAKPAT